MILKHLLCPWWLESIEHLFLAWAILNNTLIDYDGHDDWEEREDMKDIEDVESDVEGNGGGEQQDQSLRASYAGNPLNWIGATRHELRQGAVSKATDDIVLSGRCWGGGGW